MGLERKEWININHFKTLGQFYAHFSDKSEPTFPLKPVFKIVTNDDEYPIISHCLKPGYIDREDNFYQCPLMVFFVQINEIVQRERYKKDYPGRLLEEKTINLDINLFSDDHSKMIREKISFSENSHSLSFMSCNGIINRLNEYVNSGRPINKINFGHFDIYHPQRYKYSKMKGRERIIDVIDDLEVIFFSNSRNRVGKENHFWKEAEIRNLPDDRYFKNLIKSQILNQCRKIEETEYGLFVQFEIRSQWCGRFPRKKIEDSHDLIQKLKDLLKIDMANCYDSKDRSLENLIKE
jgi:hypothetical protein